jgi:hypothetical protein
VTWTKTTTLWCDGEGCYEWVETSNSTVRATRRNADGWVHTRGGDDLCPGCAAEGAGG